MKLTKRISIAMLMLAPLPAMAQDDTPSLLLSGLAVSARAPTAGERQLLPAQPYDLATDESAKRADRLLEALGGSKPPRTDVFTHLSASSVQWGSVQQPNRMLLNCIKLDTDWDVSQRAVVATLDTQCGVSIRIRASYGFKAPKGNCVPQAMIDGILLPHFGRRPLSWTGSDDRTQTACLGKIEVLGIPQWSVEQAREARDWMTNEARTGQIDRISIFDTTGNTDALGTGTGRVTDAQSDDLCALSLTTTGFGSSHNSPTARTLKIRWTDIAEVQDLSYNSFAMLKFKGAVGQEAWSLDFANFKPALRATGFDGTVAMSALVEYCRNADGG